MPEYRIYELDNDASSSKQLLGTGTWNNNIDAQNNARMMFSRHRVEIWCGERKVATIKPDA